MRQRIVEDSVLGIAPFAIDESSVCRSIRSTSSALSRPCARREVAHHGRWRWALLLRRGAMTLCSNLRWRVRSLDHADADTPTPMTAGRLFCFNVFQPESASSAQAAPRLFNATQEARVMFETIVEPVLFGLESDQHAGRFAVARD